MRVSAYDVRYTSICGENIKKYMHNILERKDKYTCICFPLNIRQM